MSMLDLWEQSLVVSAFRLAEANALKDLSIGLTEAQTARFLKGMKLKDM